MVASTAATAAAPSAKAASAEPDVFQPCAFPDFEGAVQRMSRVLTFQTVSDPDVAQHLVDPAQFRALDAYLAQAYAKVWERLQVEKLGDGGHSYLITWRGSRAELRPALFISHVDVVPVSPGTEQDWTYPPFSGAVADGYIWGRGALDVKSGVVGLLEAASALLAEGYQPARTLMFAFGQDEESGGFAGAAHIAGKLAAQGQQLEFIWDEGGTIYRDGLFPLTKLPVALVATAEKLYQEVAVTIHASGGHSSMPPIDGSSIGTRLGSFLSALSASPPVPRLVSPTRELVEGLVSLARPWLALLLRLVKLFPSAWLDSVVAGVMATTSAPAAALVRDTAAVTVLRAGVAENVLPQTAELSVNFRLLPGTPVNQTLSLLRSWLGSNAQHANITLGPTDFAPSAVTDDKGPAFQLVTQAIQEGWKFSAAAGKAQEGAGVPVLPFLMPGGTDSKHFLNLTRAILRVCPYSLSQEEMKGVHGTNERIRVADFGRLLCTYRAGLRLAGDGSGGGGGADGVGAVGAAGGMATA